MSLLRSSAMMTRTFGRRCLLSLRWLAPRRIRPAAATHQAKSKIRRSTCHLRFAAAAHQIARAVLIGAQVRSAFQHAFCRARLLRIEAVARTLWILRHGRGSQEPRSSPDGTSRRTTATRCRPYRTARTRWPETPSPAMFPRIHLRRGLWQETALPDIGGRLFAGHELVSPRIQIAIEPSARGELEFSLGWQSLAGPLRVCDSSSNAT